MAHIHEKIDFTVATFVIHDNKVLLVHHSITDTHEHIGMIYWARPKDGQLTLSNEEHHDIRWCSDDDLDTLQPPMSNAMKWYCRKALEEVLGSQSKTQG